MGRSSSWAAVLLCATVALPLVGCSKGSPEPKIAQAPTQPLERSATPEDAAGELQPIGFIITEQVRVACDLPDERPEAPRFDYDQADLRPRGETILSDVSRCLQEGPLRDADIAIIGHADPRGSDAYNLDLGRRRAASARDFLVDSGVPAERLTVISRGESQAQGDDPASWALDRRVEIDLWPSGESP